MTFPSALRTACLTAAALLQVHTAPAEPLAAFRGENRLVVFSISSEEAAKDLTTKLASNRDSIDARDLKFIDVSENGHRLPNTSRPSPEETAALRKRFGLGPGDSRQTFILIGKDGGEKARQHGSLNFETWFALIDRMPMRRAEIQKQKANR